MNNTEGWITLHRKIRNHWIWEDAIKFQAWIAILMEVNHCSGKVAIKNQVVDCACGQSIHTLHTWARRLGNNWTVMKVRNFFKMLEDDGMIIREKVKNVTRITVCNYDVYQKGEHRSNTNLTSKEQEDNNALSQPKQEGNNATTSLEHPSNNALTTNNNYNNEKNNETTNEKQIFMKDFSEINFSEDEKQVAQITSQFYQTILFNLESQKISTVRLKKAKVKTWMDPIRLILSQKEATPEQLFQLAKYLRTDLFWRKVILSTSKMREKLPQLIMAMKQPRHVGNPPAENQHFAYGNHDEAESL